MEEIAPGVFVETNYEGVNVGVVQTNEGLVCIDTPSYPRDARHWAGQLARLHSTAKRFLILTDASGDRAINARWLSARLIVHAAAAKRLQEYDKRFPQPLIDSLAQRNPVSGKELSASPVEKAALSFDEEMTVIKGETEILLQHRPGPMRSSIWVMLPAVGVLFAGDSVVVNTQPLLQEVHIDDWLSNLQHLATLKRYRILVPGRGPVGGLGLAAPLSERLATFRSLVAGRVASGQEPSANNELLSELSALFDAEGIPEEWARRQVALGADRVYNELRWDEANA